MAVDAERIKSVASWGYAHMAVNAEKIKSVASWGYWGDPWDLGLGFEFEVPSPTMAPAIVMGSKAWMLMHIRNPLHRKLGDIRPFDPQELREHLFSRLFRR